MPCQRRKLSIVQFAPYFMHASPIPICGHTHTPSVQYAQRVCNPFIHIDIILIRSVKIYQLKDQQKRFIFQTQKTKNIPAAKSNPSREGVREMERGYCPALLIAIEAISFSVHSGNSINIS